MPNVTETEMREFFQRIIDSVAELSTQAAKVDHLTQQVNTLAERLNNLETENYSLKTQISDANNTVVRMESELNSVRSHLESERAVTASLRETIVQRDAGVVSLENSFRNEQDAHKITTSERDDARTKIGELEQRLEDTNRRSDAFEQDRDHWRTKASELEATNAKLNQQIERINSVLNPLRAVTDPTQQVA